MIYIVNCDKLRFFKTFNSLDSVINYLHEKNKSEFDGGVFSLFGRGTKTDVIPNEDSTDFTLEWVEDTYYIDSVVLCQKDNRNEYFTFFIRCIDSKGNLIELEKENTNKEENP